MLSVAPLNVDANWYLKWRPGAERDPGTPQSSSTSLASSPSSGVSSCSCTCTSVLA